MNSTDRLTTCIEACPSSTIAGASSHAQCVLQCIVSPGSGGETPLSDPVGSYDGLLNGLSGYFNTEVVVRIKPQTYVNTFVVTNPSYVSNYNSNAHDNTNSSSEKIGNN
jgi:hypothetical protein